MFKVGDMVKLIKEDIESGVDYTKKYKMKIGKIYIIKHLEADKFIHVEGCRGSIRKECFVLIKSKKKIKVFGIVSFCKKYYK